MMRRSLMACALVAAGMATVGLASASTTINFGESGLTPGFGPDPWFAGNPKGTYVDNQFLGSGVKFEIANGAAYVSNTTYCAGTSTLTWDNFLAVNTTPPYLIPEAILTVSFWDPTNNSIAGWVDGGTLSFKVSDKNAVPVERVTVNTYDITGMFVEQLTLNQFEDVLAFTTGMINRVEFIDSGADGFVMDDLSFGTVGVAPEPASMAALGLGVVAILSRKRRR